MLVVVLSGFVLASVVPLLHRLSRNQTGRLLAALPLGLFAYLILFIKPIVAVALLVSLLTLYSMTKIWNDVFWKNKPEARERPLVDRAQRRASWTALILPIILLALLTLTIGLGAESLLALASKAAEQLMDPAQYISHVLGEPR